MGVISYNDAYNLVNVAIREYGEELKVLLQARFQYVFIDEYQDCSNNQSFIIDYLFNESNCVLQKIGDCDQAIYNSSFDEENAWIKSQDCLELSGSIRYHQKIADQISRLRIDDIRIKSLASVEEISPVLIVFNDTTIEKVLPTFANEILKNNLNVSDDGVFKAVGMIKNGLGLTIEKYWSDYQKEEIKSKKNLCLEDYLQEMYLTSKTRDLSLVLEQIHNLFCRLFMLLEIKSIEGVRVNASSVGKILSEMTEIDIKLLTLEIAHIISIDEKKLRIKEVRRLIIQALENVFGNELEKYQDFLYSNSEDLTTRKQTCKKKNLWEYSKGDETIEIEVSTVHKVKGETHTATLYLETETNKSSDLKRIMPLFQGKKALNSKSNIHEKSRKIAYVGMSRPTKLLCVAMHLNTYTRNEKYFLEWDVKVLSNIESQTVQI